MEWGWVGQNLRICSEQDEEWEEKDWGTFRHLDSVILEVFSDPNDSMTLRWERKVTLGGWISPRLFSCAVCWRAHDPQHLIPDTQLSSDECSLEGTVCTTTWHDGSGLRSLSLTAESHSEGGHKVFAAGLYTLRSSNPAEKPQSKPCSEEIILTLLVEPQGVLMSSLSLLLVLQVSALIIWLQCLRKAHKDQLIIWHILAIRSLSTDLKELWLQFSPWGLKNSVGHYLFTRNFWSSVEREVGEKKSKEKKASVL